ncbi:MAG: hypothetical protein JOY62_00890 [Acidobacteriaceae bacterium]|nr:hypothetical protein [Acidobacteriaceae bacterium]MBV9778502.1 hypothetical protein [Acidobacteriaceae bacterium]
MAFSRIPGVSVEIVTKIFPETPVKNIAANLPFVLNALVDAGLATREMILMALATIRVEVACFEPIGERESPLNTSPGGPAFDLYDYRSDLGNLGPPDGATFRGRGFVQLTGRANYQFHGQAIGVRDQLVTKPALASDPEIAAKLLASFIKRNQSGILAALATNDLAKARRCINGGTHGIADFEEAYAAGIRLIPEHLEILPSETLLIRA